MKASQTPGKKFGHSRLFSEITVTGADHLMANRGAAYRMPAR